MNALLVASRAVHYASALLLFGELVFAFAVARRASRDPRPAAADDIRDLDRQTRRVAGLGITASIASGIAWFAAEASAMSGMSIERALNPDTLALILGRTTFGRLLALRFGLIAGLCAAVLAMRRSGNDRLQSRLRIGAVAIAAAYLASLGSTGHAAAGQGLDRFVRIVADDAHLLAAGAWVGALPGLVLFLGSAQPLEVAVRVTRRFSTLAVGSVAVLVASGLVSAWYLVGDFPALFGTDYGQLLLFKLALFAAMATVAMVNRWYLIPRLVDSDRGALRSLRRNAIVETALGIGVVTVVGALGITVPARHDVAVWPFAHTLGWEAAEQAVWIGAVLGAAAVIALVAAGGVLGGLRSHRPRYWLAGLAGIAAAALTWIWLLAVPAHPTTYVASPVRYTTDSIAHGAAVYARSCRECHGADGHGGGGRASLAQMDSSPGRIDYAKYRYPGDLFWLIAHGIAGTAMPGFTPRLGDADIWALIQFLRAESESKSVTTLTDRVDPRRPIVAPDFTFEVPGRSQQSLKQQSRSQPSPVLVVLYTLPASRQRLAALAGAETALAESGVRIIAVALDASSTSAGPPSGDGNAMQALVRPDVAAVYAMFARSSADAGSDAPRHVEFLIDRQGYLRARWIGIPDAATNRTADILGQIDVLKREPDDAANASGH